MALLQISEPGQTPDPHARKIAVGIDLGTTHSLIASVVNGLPTLLKDVEGHAILPSIVHYSEAGADVGRQARTFAETDPLNTLFSIKRLMGRSHQDVLRLGEQTGFQFVDSDAAVPVVKTAAGNKTAVEVSADILSALSARAKARFLQDIDGAVITVPAYFDDAQRQATKDAATLAGIPVLRLLNEPTAAAIAYGLDQKEGATIAVYDLGGGTFDITLLKFHEGVFEVLSTGGDSQLGGDDVDHAIADWFLTHFPQTLDAASHRKLLLAARKAKEALTFDTVTPLSLDEQSIALDRDQLAGIATPLIEKTVAACKQALLDGELDKTALDAIVMVGGSTRLQAVRDEISQFFGQTVLTDIDPDTVVALGASIQADILIGNQQDADLLLLDVIPLSLGLETMGGLVEKVIPRNTTIPVARAQEFTTSKDGQTAMAIHVLQGERDLVEDCRSLARFELKGIPPMTAGAAKIRVTFQVDADGLLSVSATELETGVESAITVKPSYGLTDEEITQMLQSSIEHAGIDKDARALREQQVEAQRLIDTLNEAIAKDADSLLSADEKRALVDAVNELVELNKTADKETIGDKIQAVSVLSEPFAEKRMDAAIKKALAGHSLDEFDET
ncbi:MAG: Fe-S protein assembly chaperone HscA [Cellvibrionales bacterium]|nr:Fe-S protein assembly chaperone HscA [Cellvibrionales bacterium]